MRRRLLQSGLAAALAAAAVSAAPAAHADPVGFSVAIGGPGYAIAFGNAPYRAVPAWPAYGYRHDGDGRRYAWPRWAAPYAAPPAGYVVSADVPPVAYAPPVGYVVSNYPPRVVYAPRAVYATPVLHHRWYARRRYDDRFREHRFDRD